MSQEIDMTNQATGIHFSSDDELFWGAAHESEAACTVSPVDTHRLPPGGFHFAPGAIEAYKRRTSKFARGVLIACGVMLFVGCVAAASYGLGHAWVRLGAAL